MKQRTVFHILAALLLTVSVFALYGESMDVGFVGDDHTFLDASNSWDKVARSFTSDWFFHNLDITGARFYRPLQILLTYIELQVWGENAWGFHLDLLFIHTINSILLCLLVALLMGESAKRHPWIPWLAALIFALHPRHSESICMINGRTDSLCALFYLLSLTTYIHWRRKYSRISRWFSLAAFVLALMAKEMAVSLPVLLILYELSRYRRNCIESNNNLSIEPYLKAASLHWIALFLVFGILRTWALGGYIYGKSSYVRPVANLDIYLLSICKLTTVLCLPFESIIRSLASYFVASPGTYGWTIAALTGLGLAVALYRGSCRWSVGLGLWLIGAAPILTQLTEFETTLSDRYLYIPSLGVSVILADLLIRGRRIHALAGMALVLGVALWIAAGIPPNRKYVAEWREAGRTAASIVAQIERLDKERPIEERFCFLSLPVLYQGKYVLDTGFERYFNQKKLQQGKPIRLLTPLLQMDMLDPPNKVHTETIFRLDRIQQSVRGGYYRFPLRLAHPQIRLVTESTRLPGNEAHFKTQCGPYPLILLEFDRGKVKQVSMSSQSIVFSQGSGGEGIIKRYRPYTTEERSKFTIPQSMQQNALISPLRGLHLSSGDVDGDGVDDLVTTLGPTDDPTPPYPGLLFIWKSDLRAPIGHPFSPFPKNDDRPIANPSGEVRTAVGRFIPGRDAYQIACAQGIGGKQIIRLFEYTGEEQPHGFQLIGQFMGFDERTRGDNDAGGVCLASGDFNGDGVDELVLGQADAPQRPHIQIASLTPPDELGTVALRASTIFRAYPDAAQNNGKGATLAVGDVNDDGSPEIVTAVASPETPHTRRPNLYVWRVEPTENGSFDQTLADSVYLMKEDTGLTSIHSIRLACGNLDSDETEEIIVCMTGENETYRDKVIAYKHESKVDGLELKFYAAYDIGAHLVKLFDSVDPLGWIDVVVLRSND